MVIISLVRDQLFTPEFKSYLIMEWCKAIVLFYLSYSKNPMPY